MRFVPVVLLWTCLVHSAGAQSWVSIGPEQIGNNEIGRVTAIAIDPANENHWIAGGATGGIWESRDAGQTWSPRTDAQPTLATGAVAFAPGNSRIVYAGTGEVGYSQDAFAGLGLLKSVDGGLTWTLVASPNLAGASFSTIRVHPSDPNTLEAATTRGRAGRNGGDVATPPQYGMLRSTDGGATWRLLLPGEVTALEVDPTNWSNQYAGIGTPCRPVCPLPFAGARENGVYRTRDGGATWEVISAPWTSMAATTGRVALAISPSKPSTLYAAIPNPASPTSSAQGLLGLFRTDNAWADTPTWIQVPASATGARGYCADTLGVDQCGSTHVLAVDPADPDTLVAGSRVIWRCTRCGSAPLWTDIGKNIHADFRVLLWRNNLLVTGNDGGIRATTDRGETWTRRHDGLAVTQIYGAALHPRNPNFLLAGTKDNGCIIWKGGTGWDFSPAQPANPTASRHASCEGEVALSTSRPETHWLSAAGQNIARSTDGGKTVEIADQGIDWSSSVSLVPVRQCPANEDVFLTGSSRLWRTDNFFGSALPSWTANSPAGVSISAIAFAPSDAACRTYAYANVRGSVAMTTNAGNTWLVLDPDNTDPAKKLPGRPITSLAFDPNNPAVLYVAFSGFDETADPVVGARRGHLFKTANTAANPIVWTDITPPANIPLNVIAIDPGDSKSIFVGTDAAIWRSPDGGTSWTRMGPNSGLPNAPIFDIKINRVTQRAVAFTFGRGAYALSGLGFQPPPPPLAIRSVSHGATYAAGGLVPGSWAQVLGSNLAGVTRIWSDADFAGLGNGLPTKLDGVEVKVRGVSAAVYYISPGQVNFQVPSGILDGPAGNILVSSPVTVQVFRDGIASNILNTIGVSSSPGIFPILAGGKIFPAGVFTDGMLTGDPALGPAFRKARPGDLIQLYATGLIRNQSGIVPNIARYSGVAVKLGEVTVAADVSALVAVGEFQVNFRVPQQFASLPEGDYPISVQIRLDDGETTSSPLTINSDSPGSIVLPIQH